MTTPKNTPAFSTKRTRSLTQLRGCANRAWVMACGVDGYPSDSGSRPGE